MAAGTAVRTLKVIVATWNLLCGEQEANANQKDRARCGKTRFFSNDSGKCILNKPVDEQGLKQMCQQEESYSSPNGILFLLQLSSPKPQ